MTDSCRTCAKRNQHYETVILHPNLAESGVGYCQRFERESSRIWITPDVYWCGEFERAKPTVSALDDLIIPSQDGPQRIGDLNRISREQIEDSSLGVKALTAMLKQSGRWVSDANGTWLRV